MEMEKKKTREEVEFGMQNITELIRRQTAL